MSVTQLIDSHCHLDFEVFDNDRTEVLQRAIDNNISDIIIPGTERIFWDRVKLLCKGNPRLHACYGIHPYWLNRHKKQDIQALAEYIESNHAVALGECGLDFRPRQADKKTQMYFFEAQLATAENSRLPVVIHSVKATETVIQTIKKFKNLRGMIHSYSGSCEQAKQLIALNFLISVSAGITYDNAKKIRAVVKEIPLTSLLLETDAPDQPDKDNANSRNEPAFLINTLHALAKIRGVSPETIAAQTSINARTLFNI
ncbi:MAG: TatD family hydrolase [Gammaproteobacteria bacterium]|jgi:TatD DNase family protein|nr:TatD family hydrolase [Gammaproteobacteria bacterium]